MPAASVLLRIGNDDIARVQFAQMVFCVAVRAAQRRKKFRRLVMKTLNLPRGKRFFCRKEIFHIVIVVNCTWRFGGVGNVFYASILFVNLLLLATRFVFLNGKFLMKKVILH